MYPRPSTKLGQPQLLACRSWVWWGSRPGPSDAPGMGETAAGVLGIHRRVLRLLWGDDGHAWSGQCIGGRHPGRTGRSTGARRKPRRNGQQCISHDGKWEEKSGEVAANTWSGRNLPAKELAWLGNTWYSMPEAGLKCRFPKMHHLWLCLLGELPLQTLLFYSSSLIRKVTPFNFF